MTLTSQSGPYVQTPSSDEIVHLGLGQPSPSLLPWAAFAEVAIRRLRLEQDPLILQYGVAAGYEGFRSDLAAFLSRRYGLSVHPDALFMSGGNSSALAWVGALLNPSKRPVVCEDPSYFLAQGIMSDLGFEMRGVPVDDQGLDVAHLEGELKRGLRPAFVYCIPTFHNPTSVSLSPARARRLVDLAEHYDFVVVADEPYVLLHFEDAPDPPMMHYDEGRGRVVGLGSFSKILGPGLRLGWVHAAPPLIDRLAQSGVIRSGGGWNPLVAALAHAFIAEGQLDRHIDTLRETFRRRAQVLTAALERELPALRVQAPRGGYFAWVQVPGAHDLARELEVARADHGVGFTPGSRCSSTGRFQDFMRVSFSFYTSAELELGVVRLAAFIARPRQGG